LALHHHGNQDNRLARGPSHAALKQNPVTPR
jgi:hypothetical protein